MSVILTIKKVLVSSWFLAILPSLLVIASLPPTGSKYTLEISSKKVDEFAGFYSDLDSDGYSEFISFNKGNNPFYHFIIINKDNQFIQQWNIQDSLTREISKIFIGNSDHDKFKELYFFSYNYDSLFLNILKTPHQNTKLNRYFITKLDYVKGQVFSVVWNCGFYDQNKDGRDEVYLTINTGYAREPRRVYSFDMENKHLISSKYTGSIYNQTRM